MIDQFYKRVEKRCKHRLSHEDINTAYLAYKNVREHFKHYDSIMFMFDNDVYQAAWIEALIEKVMRDDSKPCSKTTIH